VQATRERHLLCPSADAFCSNVEWRLALRGTWQTAKQATVQPREQATGRPSGKPAAMSAKTAQNLRRRSDAAMASVPTSLWNPFPQARQVSTRYERRWGRQRQLKAQAHLATERRARQTERCPAYSVNKLCRGKPHGRRQGGKDLASDRGRCAALQNGAKHATPQGAG
jgi:TfoX/Sxy family transcriptional regulator of competence genes